MTTTSLDPDDPRPPYQQVANQLRAAILTRKINAGDKLPSQTELSERYGVARMTIQQALRVLREEGLIVSRQGSGVYVRAKTSRPVALRPQIEVAFKQRQVRIDFCGYTSETLYGLVQAPLDLIRDGVLQPESIQFRVLLSDMTIPQPIPTRVEGGDDPAVRQRMAKIAERYTGGLIESITELADLGLIPSATVEARVFGTAPLFKLYLINEQELFFGFYPVIQHTVTIGGEQVPIFDPMGKDAQLFHHVRDNDPESTGSQYVTEAARWFDSVWDSIATEYRP